MERHLQLKIQGPSNNAAQQENLDERLVERGGGGALGYGYGDFLLNTQQEQFLKEKQQTSPAMFALPSLLGKMSFLEMLQSMDSPPFSPPHPFTQSTSWLHQQQQQKKSCTIKIEMLESCISHEICEEEEARSRVKCHSHPAVVSKCCYVGASISGSGSAAEEQLSPQMRNNTIWPPKGEKIRKKRERTMETTTERASKKNKEQMESQRMTHITVERNRRKQMNDHLNALRSLMPTAFVQKGDQASIIGGAIDFVKELEQLLQSLEVEKRMRMHASSFSFSGDTTSSSSCNNSNNNNTNMMTSESPQESEEEEEEENDENEIGRRRSVYISELLASSPHDQHNIMMNDVIVNKNESKSSSGNGNKRKDMEIQVMVIELHVNLKIVCPRRQGQLLRVIAAFEGIGLTVLHVNVNSFDSNSLLYSFNLKIEDGCQFGSADEIAAVVNQIFSYINNNNGHRPQPHEQSRWYPDQTSNYEEDR